MRIGIVDVDSHHFPNFALMRIAAFHKAKDRYAKNLADFAKFCVSHQWIPVEEHLPEEETMVVAHSPNGRIDVLKYHDGEFIDELGQAHCVDYYIHIPQLNPEKKKDEHE